MDNLARVSAASPALEPALEPAPGEEPPRGSSAWSLSTARLRSAVTPVPRAAGFYARSWRRYLSRPAAGAGVPVVRPTVALATQALLDEVVLAGFRTLRPANPRHTLQRAGRETRAALELYASAGWLEEPEGFFPAPPPLTDPHTRPARARQLAYTRLSFDSGYRPHAGEPGRERWSAYGANRRARAWLLRHDEPRPWLVCVHGASMGRPLMDLALFRARWLHHDLGLNVVFPVLPLHGPRRRDLPEGAGFPGEDVLDNVHAAAQSVWDIRRILSWIRKMQGDTPVGITGISLGGYVTSLVASLEDGLACAIPGVPAVDLAGLIEHHAGLRHDDELREELALAKQLGRVVSPLALTPRVPPEGRFIYAGLADRLVHPRHQVARLWEHWGRPDIEWYNGSHTGFFRSRPVGRFLLAALERSGLVDPSRGAQQGG
jgi:dienelactone hydrolase